MAHTDGADAAGIGEDGDTIDVVYAIYQNDDSRTALSPEAQPIVDRALKLWADARRDTWLSVQLCSGAEISLLASSINAAIWSTRDNRRADTRRDKALLDERAAFRREAGFIESE